MTRASASRILVVEDEAIIRAFLADGLTDAGYEVETAENGADALDRLEAYAPDVVLLDLLMPVMDGWAFLRERQDDPRLSTVPVVVLSAAGMEPLRRASALRATAVLSKPLNLDVLSAVLEHVLRDISGADIPTTNTVEEARFVRQALGTCPICGLPTYAVVDQALMPPQRLLEIYAARRAHVLSHNAADIARAPLRRRVLDLPTARRRILSKWVYHDLRQEWGDNDRRSVHSIQEVLDSPAVHRLWHLAAACGYDGCNQHG